VEKLNSTIREIAVECFATDAATSHRRSSYSFRMFHATGADVYNAGWSLTLELGWSGSHTEKLDGPSKGDSLCPARYAGRKEETAEFAKCLMMSVARAGFQKSCAGENRWCHGTSFVC